MSRARDLGLAAFAGAVALASCAQIAGIRKGTLRETGTVGSTGGGGAGGTIAAGGSPPASVRPPERPKTTSMPGTAKSVAFAPRRYFLGQHDTSCEPNPETDVCTPNKNAWRKMGFDIDGVTTTQDLALSGKTGTCKRKEGTPNNLLEDGDDGRDNSFGVALYPNIIGLAPGGPVEGQINKSVRLGQGLNVVMVLTNLDDGPDDELVFAFLYSTAITNEPPVWNGSYHYKIDGKSLKTSQITEPKVAFLKGYLHNHVFVSGTFNDVTDAHPAFLPLPSATGFVTIDPDAATWVIELSPDHTKALRTTLSLVVNPPQFAEAMRPVVHQYLNCSDSLAEALLGPVYKYGDLLSGAPDFLDPTGTKECDRMSMAFEMDMQPVAVPVQADVTYPDPVPDKCAMGGGGAGGA